MVDVSAKLDQAANKKKTIDLIKKQKVGGIILMKGEYSLSADWVREFQKTASTPLMVSIDGEWGIHMRIANTTKFPYALTLGAIDEESELYRMGKAIAEDCKRLGIHVNFAPVADININPNNPVINYRSFGENKENVFRKSLQYALGMQENGVMAVAKHFPGHGDTDMDSHHDLPVIDKPLQDLEKLELYPFQKLIQKGIWGMMVAHLKVPAVDPTGTPSSLSQPIITDLLKSKMKFEGLVFSDALNMKGVSTYSTAGKMELDAYLAGNDILLFSENVEKGIQRIEEYIKANPDAKEELNERIEKILLFKHKLGCHAPPNLTYSHDESSNDALATTLYEKSITYLSEENIPFESWNDNAQKTLYISLSDMSTELRKRLEKSTAYTFFNLPSKTASELYDLAAQDMKNYDKVIVAYHDLSQSSSKNFGLNAAQINFIANLKNRDNVLHLWFGNPYGLKYFQEASNIVLAYEDNFKTQTAVYNYLQKKSAPLGKLPVSVGKFKEGEHYTAIPASKTTIVDVSPVGTTMDKAAVLSQIESLCQEILWTGAAPGFQMVVNHQGKQIYNKSYGKHNYGEDAPTVKNTDLYDLASLTKILSTTLAAMKLYEQGKLKLDGQVGDYLLLDDSATIGTIYIYQLLTHEAGLTPFIPFYQRFHTDNYYTYFSNEQSPDFPYPVARNMYVRKDYADTMWQEISHSTLKNIGSYRYSDLSMYILQRIIERITGEPLDKYVVKNFYSKMGVSLTYKPILKYSLSKITPTEYDDKFRLQLVHGYVHDQGCALYGQVCGHAGLFGNATDVSKVMQMLLNGGLWNGTRLLRAETITKFTEQQRIGSRRGLGFDKPNTDDPSASSPTAKECSFATFGHTGFTGTCAWGDPFHQMVFVFLSNRIYPSADNKKLARGDYRERLQALFYQYINAK